MDGVLFNKIPRLKDMIPEMEKFLVSGMKDIEGFVEVIRNFL